MDRAAGTATAARLVRAAPARRQPATCAGKGFDDRRDTALVLLLVDVGPRRAELMGAKVVDLDFDLDVLLVLGKGRRERAPPFGRKTALALDRYLRVRARHKDAALPWLWLGLKGRFRRGAWCRCCATAGKKPASLGCTRTSCATPSRTSGSPRAAVRPT